MYIRHELKRFFKKKKAQAKSLSAEKKVKFLFALSGGMS